jgi:hypothetical protein
LVVFIGVVVAVQDQVYIPDHLPGVGDLAEAVGAVYHTVVSDILVVPVHMVVGVAEAVVALAVTHVMVALVVVVAKVQYTFMSKI